jgi:hypothetical protein
MAQHDYVIANGTGAAVRSDLNGSLAAIVSNNSGATEPTTMYAYQWWADTTTGLLKLRNSANNAWISLRELDGTLTLEDGTAAAPGLAFTSDLNTGLFRVGADQVAITTGGTSRLAVSTTAVSSTLAVDVLLGAVGTPSLTFTGDLNTGIYSPGADQVAITTGGTARLNADTAAVTSTLPVVHPLGAVGTPSITFTGDLNTGIWSPAADTIAFSEGGAEAMRIDSSSRILVGTSTARSNLGGGTLSAGLQLEGVSNNNARYMAHVYNANDVGYPLHIFAKSRGTAVGSNTIVQSGDFLGGLTFEGADGTNFIPGAFIAAQVDGTPGANDMPGRLVFSTTADGASSPTERMRIDNAGNAMIGTTNSNIGGTTTTGINLTSTGTIRAGSSGSGAALFNRISNDGDIVFFQQDGTTEGTISVSGTTVSYNGAHLSRWSQLPGGAEREEILRGTVLSNIDEMCGWGEEENEQLNRMQVSEIEGDKNVAGVFQCWDDDDDTYTDDFYCAMTGDFIIRIAESVTVERGDLLMSAGDGTAKPQDDDIIRSKTVAKVTSTHVTCTYEDGSYCVPCVLMAC